MITGRWSKPFDVPLRKSRERTRVLIPGLAFLTACGGGDRDVSGVRYVPVIELETGTDTLAIDESQQTVAVAATGDGGWLVAGLASPWKWAEFDADGNLIRAPGRRGDGPGEFRQVRYVIPLTADTVLVVERGQTTRALRDGTYIGHDPLPMNVQSWARVGAEVWLAGMAPGTIPAIRYSGSGELLSTHRYAIGDDFVGGELFVWQGDPWIWAYPRGPAIRLDPSTGEVLEEWQPFDDWVEISRGWPVTGPGGTLIFHRRLWVDDHLEPEHNVFDSDRQMMLEFVPPDSLGTMRWGHDPPVWITKTVERPVRMAVGVRILRPEFCRGC